MCAAESPAAGSSCEHSVAFRSPARTTAVMETPTKQSPVRSPLKGILRTPVKALVEGPASSGSLLLHSPLSRTPKKTVTWSPSPRKCGVSESSVTFKVPESPRVRTSQRLLRAHDTSCSPVRTTNPKRDLFKTPEKTCEVSPARTPERGPRSSEDLHHRLETPERSSDEMQPLPSTPPPQRHTPPTPDTRSRTPSPTHLMITRSGRTPSKRPHAESPFRPVSTPGGGASVHQASDSSVKSLMRKRSGPGGRTTRHNLRSQPTENVPSNTNPGSAEFCEQILPSPSAKGQAEPSQTSDPDSSSLTDSQLGDSSHFKSVSTDDDSLDIVDAAVVKTQFTGGLKMNICFSRKSSQSGEDLLFSVASPKPRAPPHDAPGRSYGFRQTPDRQQREAAARLGYGNESSRFSTPRGPARPRRQKETATPNPLTYQVEMEMQTSGLPKLKIKRTDSLTAGDSAAGAQSPVVGLKPSLLESPLALFSKHRDPGCVSPSLCAHVTPAKSTPGKGGSVQTYICQSYTPTRLPAGTVSPVALTIPLTPSPPGVGKTAPDNLNSWPRRKRAQVGAVGGKDRSLKAEPLLVELLEEAELGVSRLQDVEDGDEPANNQAASVQSALFGAASSSPSPPADFYWLDKLAHQAGCADPQTAEEEMMPAPGNQDVKSRKLCLTLHPLYPG